MLNQLTMKNFAIQLSLSVLCLFIVTNPLRACSYGGTISVLEIESVCGVPSNRATVRINVDGLSSGDCYRYRIIGRPIFETISGPIFGPIIVLGPQRDPVFSDLPAGTYTAEFYALPYGETEYALIKTKNFSVSADDNIPPIARCKNVRVQLGADGTFQDDTSLIDDGSTDNCSISPGRPLINFDCSHLGPKLGH